MNGSLVFSMVVFALLEVVRAEYHRAYGHEAKDCLEYVGLVAASLLLVLFAFPGED
jgi:hypothetical protein